MIELSVVIPLYNEEENVQPLLRRLRQSLQDYCYEVLLVDDGSSDRTLACVEANADENILAVSLPRNHGQSFALKTGIDLARGKFIVTMDGDLQNDPANIPHLLNEIKAGSYDMVAGYRLHRKDAWYRTWPSRLANRLIRYTTGVYLKDYGCTLKIFRKDLAKSLDLHGELHRFIPVLARLQGAKIGEIPVCHYPRVHGQSKYGLNRTIKVISDLIMVLFFQKYWARAMHLFGSFGVIILLVGIGLLSYLLGVKLWGGEIGGRPLLLLGILSVLGGLQFISFGLVAEMLYRIHNRPLAPRKQKIPPYRKLPKKKYLATDELLNDHSAVNLRDS